MSFRKPTPALLPLVALLVLAIPLVPYLGGVELDASTRVLLSGDKRSSASFQQLERYLKGRALVALIVGHDDLFSNKGMHAVRDLSRRLRNVPGVTNVKSLTHFERPVRHGLSLDVSEMISFEPLVPAGRRDDAEWDQLADWVLHYPLARDLLVSSDGRYAMLLVIIERRLGNHADKQALREELELLVEPTRELDGVSGTHLFAFPFIEAEMQQVVTRDVQRLGLALLALVFAILLVTYRSLTVLLWVLLLEALGLACLPQIFRLQGDSLNLFTSMLIPLIAGLQLAFLAHICSAVQRQRRAGRRGVLALAAAAHSVFWPSLVAALTSAIGLLALLSCEVETVREFGLYGAQGVGLVFVLVFGGPLLIGLWARFTGRGQELTPPVGLVPTIGERLVVRMVGVLVRRCWWVAGVAVVLVAVCIPGVLRVRSDMRAMEYLGDRTATRQALNVLDLSLGGINALQLEVDTGEPGAIARPENLAFMERVREHALTQPGVTSVYSYSLLFCLMHQLWMQDAPGSLSLPGNPFLTGIFAAAIYNQHFPLREVLQDGQRQRSNIVLRTRDMPASKYLEVVREVEAFARAEAPDGVDVRVRDGVHSLLASDRQIVRGQRSSLGLGILAVFVALWLLWRSLRLALLVVLCNLPALAVILGLFGYAGMPLNSITVMVAAVVLGIAVDDSIHLVSHYRSVRLQSDDRERALAETLVAKLQPMMATTAIMVSGLGLLGISSIPPVVHFGLSAALALVVALSGSVLLLPALVEIAFRRDPLR